ncbi:MAG TPA: histidinol phosphate phosphatase domain-containing protein [Syntrophorhabdales bacterium]|nr:histidinol phosphate phosphatase domain-containing protein [Syntrophorhabdales bacterium]
MIDLHTHTFFSDGELVPSELARRAYLKGYDVLGISDHADSSNIDFLISAMLKLYRKARYYTNLTIVPGIELTHVPPGLIKELTRYARRMGARLVIVHGESIVEPVEEGTNRAAIEAGVDILAHPGLISEEEVMLAKKKNVHLEITAKRGHSLANGHVARLATKLGAKLIYSTDAHAPSDLLTEEMARKVVQGAGLLPQGFSKMQENARELVRKAMERK